MVSSVFYDISFKLFPEFRNLRDMEHVVNSREIQINEHKREQSLKSLLLFTYQALLEDSLSFKIAELLCILHGYKEFEIANLASKCLGIVLDKSSTSQPIGIPSIQFGWRCIQLLLKKETEYKVIGYKMWLRWLNNPDESIQNLFCQDLYWAYIQAGIMANSYDFKRYSMHLLSRSLQLIDTSIDLENMKFNSETESSKVKYYKEWKRYSSLIEIVSLDTSINQTEASFQDIYAIMKTDSLIPKTWSLVLLTSALKSSMEKIKKIVLYFLLDMPNDGMLVFLTQGKTCETKNISVNIFLLDSFLPAAVQASYFVTVSESADGCSYGSKLAFFIQRLLTSQKDSSGFTSIANSLLEFLYNTRYSFDIARAYLLKGIYDGISKCDNSGINNQGLNLICQLTKSKAETQLRQNFMTDYYLMLLSRCTLTFVGIDLWYRTLEHIYQTNSNYVLNNIRIPAIYIKENNVDLHDIQFEEVVLYVELVYAVNGTVKEIGSLGIADQCKIIRESSQGCKFLSKSDHFKNSVKDNCERGCSQSQLATASTIIKNELANEISASNILESSLKKEDNNFEQFYGQLALAYSLNLRTLFSVNYILDILTTSFVGFVSTEERTFRDLCISVLFNVLCTCQLNDNTFRNILTIIDQQFNSSGYEARLSISRFLLKFTSHESNYNFVLHNEEAFMDCLSTMWVTLIDERIMAHERELHVTLLKATFENISISGKLQNSEDVLEKIANIVIEASFSRRSLLPLLSDLLFQYKSLWVGRIFIRIYTYRQLDDNSFRLEPVLAKILDLNEPGTGNYEGCYGKEEVSARISCIEYFQNIDPTRAKELFEFLVTSDYHVLQPVRRNDGAEEITRMRCYQILILLESKITDRKYLFQCLREKFLKISIGEEPSQNVRIYLEWLIARIYASDMLEENKALNMILFELDKPHEPRILISFLRIGLLVGRHLKTCSSEETIDRYYSGYLHRALAYSTVNRSGVRHAAVSMIIAVGKELAETRSIQLLNYKQLIERISRNAETSEGFSQFITGEAKLWNISHISPEYLCNRVIKQVSGKAMDIINEKAIMKYTKLHEYTKLFEPENIKDSLQYIEKERETKSFDGPSRDIQVKSDSWSASIDFVDDTRSKSKIKRGDLILLASLVDKPPNLGGICRLSDVLGVGLLCLNDMNIVSHAQFKNVSVTAEHWMPMTEVKTEDIISYLLEKKREGYTLMGLEQTDNSVQLSSNLQFPKKAVLLLGKEREGIPGQLLAELDFCVEIKQVGVVRSMNIQTATAIVVQAYSSQHC